MHVDDKVDSLLYGPNMSYVYLKNSIEDKTSLDDIDPLSTT